MIVSKAKSKSKLSALFDKVGRTMDKIKDYEKHGYPELANKIFEDLPEGNLKKLVLCLLVTGIA